MSRRDILFGRRRDRLTLTFEDVLIENRFQDQHFRASLARVRIMSALLALLSTGVALVDLLEPAYSPRARYRRLALRACVALVFLLLTFAAYTRITRRNLQRRVAAALALVGLLTNLAYVIDVETFGVSLWVALPVAVVSAISMLLLRLRFVWAAAVGVANIAGALVFPLVCADVDTESLLHTTLYLACAVALCAAAARLQEDRWRTRFVQSHFC